MSEFGIRLFAGSRFLRWTLAPLAIVSALVLAVLQLEARGLQLALFLALELALVLLALTAIAPNRFSWAGRGLAGLVFLAYVAYLLSMLVEQPSSFWPPSERSAATGFNSLLGLLVIGYPSFKYALLGRFSWREQLTEEVGEDDAAV